VINVIAPALGAFQVPSPLKKLDDVGVPDIGVAIEVADASRVLVALGSVSVAVTASVGDSVVLPLVVPFNTTVPIIIL